MTAARLPLAETAAVRGPRSTRPNRYFGALPPLCVARYAQTPAPTTRATTTIERARFMSFTGLDGFRPCRYSARRADELPAPDAAVQARQVDAIVGERLRLEVLGAGQLQLGVGQLEDR